VTVSVSSVVRLLLPIALYILLAFVAARLVTRSIREATRVLKLALKLEITSNVGRLNFIAMILYIVAMFVFNLHQMITDALSIEGTPRAENHVVGPAILIGLFFIGSLICVMVVEKQK
jgi:ACR3 family arsenite efflux pump ArsB